MKILHLYKDYHPIAGGIENHIKVLAEAQAKKGFDVTVLVCAPGLRSVRQTLNGVRIIKAPRLCTALSMPISIHQPLSALGIKADIVHVHSPYPLGEITAWFKRGTPLVITHHSDVVRQKSWMKIYGPLYRRVLKRAACVIATSPRYIETSPWLKPIESTCRVVPLGVDADRFRPPPEAPPHNELLFVGKLRYYKGLGALLRALRDMPDARLKIAGNGPMENTWKALADELGIQDRVTFLGHVPDNDLPRLYREAGIFALPANARSEAFGTVLLEAMASGVPCLTTEIGTGTSWIVEDGVTGRIVPPDNPAAIAAALRDMLEDHEKLGTMRLAARRRVEDYFTEQKMVEGVSGAYDLVQISPRVND